MLPTLLIPRIVSTSSCSIFSFACHKKSVRDVYSIWRSRMWNRTMTMASIRALLISNGRVDNLQGISG